MRRLPFLRGVASGAAMVLALAGMPSLAQAEPQGDFEQLIAEADEHLGEGRHDEALKAYGAAFRAMPAELKSSEVGEFVAVAVGKAALDDYAQRSDRRSLEQARDILRAFVAAVKRADPANDPAPIEAATQRLSEIDALLADLDAAEDPSSSSAPPPPPPAEDPLPTTEPEDVPPDRSRVGLVLAVSGGVAAVAGVGLVIAGARQVPWYEDKLAAEGWLPTDEGYDEQIASAERTRNLDYGLGAGALVIGLGLGITGAVLMARSKKVKARDVAWGPMLELHRAGVAAVVRF